MLMTAQIYHSHPLYLRIYTTSTRGLSILNTRTASSFLTTCPNKSDCQALETCIARLTTEAKTENNLAFEEYLKGAPTMTDTTDRTQCGRVRGYFGFDELLVHDREKATYCT